MAPASYHVHSRRLTAYHSSDTLFGALFGADQKAFWLDSSLVMPGTSRFSFMGLLGDALVLEASDRDRGSAWLLDTVRSALARCRADAPDLPFDFIGGYVGYLGYEARPAEPHVSSLVGPMPDAQLFFVDRFLAIDHEAGNLYLVGLDDEATGHAFAQWADAIEARISELPSPTSTPTPIIPNVTFTLHHPREQYLALIERALALIAAGDSYEICLTNMISTPTRVDPLALYTILRNRNPAPFSALLRMGDLDVLSASPESFLRVDRARTVQSKPIKGTIARGTSSESDRLLKEKLRSSVKDQAENLMIVDLLRNDLSHVCKAGSVRVPHLMSIESFATVHHMVSTIVGQLREECDAIDAIAASFPGGSMTGAPKTRTLEILDELEGYARGIYSGAIGYLSANGCADLNIVIRTIVQTQAGCELGVGGAIVADSDPNEEFVEIMLKAQGTMEAIAEAATGNPHAFKLLN